MSTQYQMHTQLPRQHHGGAHLVALLAVPVVVFATAYAVWNVLKQQCAALTTQECLPVGSMELATFLAAGLAAIIEVLST